MEKQNTIETRYGKMSDYNRTRVLNEVAKMIQQDGGEILHGDRVKIMFKPYTMEENEQKRKTVESLQPVEKWAYKYCGYGDTLSFIYNGYYYNISYDDNPFFPITYTKIKIDENGNYIGKRYSYSNEDLNEKQYKKDGNFAFSIGYDGLFKICGANDICKMAQYHYEQMKTAIINGRESETYNEKRRVKNYYDNGYHYERIYDKTPCNIYGQGGRA